MKTIFTLLLVLAFSQPFANEDLTINGISLNMNAYRCSYYSNLHNAYLISLGSIEKLNKKISELQDGSEDQAVWRNLLSTLETEAEKLQEVLVEYKRLEIYSAQVTLSQPVTLSKDKLSDSIGNVVITPVKLENNEEINIEGTVLITAYGPAACGNVEEAEGDINKAIRENILSIFSF